MRMLINDQIQTETFIFFSVFAFKKKIEKAKLYKKVCMYNVHVYIIILYINIYTLLEFFYMH